MKTLILVSMLISTLFAFTACNEGSAISDIEPGSIKSAAIDGTEECDSTFSTTIDDLNDEDIAGILLMREEEKLAHDVYMLFFEQHELSIFTRIAQSESQHALKMLQLINHFELVDPTLDEAGSFSNETLQALYNELTAAGSESAVEALKAGALIEETDIADLRQLIEATSNADLLKVYTNLLNGSYNHLRAFVNTLKRYELEYEAQVLSAEDLEAILATASANKQGNGNAQGNKGQGEKNGQGGNGYRNGNSGNQGSNGGTNGANGQGGNGNGDGSGTCTNG
ncbi:DUF2202 domain-containing protein [Roseimarinus sediminis]|uniref:DUF2202 domain-containing protein n=1 Tax=Roseimarinus sediminis TaxID=1610899 RepID=UPI003D2228AC